MTPPTRYALAPVEATEEMAEAISLQADCGYHKDAWTDAIAASPNGGRITAEMLERAARVVHDRDWPDQDWGGLDAETKGLWIEDQRAALTALGLQVAAPAGEVVDG